MDYYYQYYTKEQAKQRGQARKKAEGLLMEHLNLRQRVSYKELGYFYEPGRWGRQYRFNRSGALRCGKTAMCIGYGFLTDVPKEDEILAKLLLLRANERKFRRTANFDRRPVALYVFPVLWFFGMVCNLVMAITH